MIASQSPSHLTAASPMPNSKNAVDRLDPDIREALDHPRISVVRPEWVYECRRVSRRLPESDYKFSPTNRKHIHKPASFASERTFFSKTSYSPCSPTITTSTADDNLISAR